MTGPLASLSLAESISLLLVGVLIGLVVLIAWRSWKESQVPPAELERRRRAWLNSKGKMGDATLVEIRDQLIFYSYDVRGVEYTASQDVSALVALLPADPKVLFGTVAVKYDPRNPANSMVLCEDWSGLRAPPDSGSRSAIIGTSPYD